MKRSAPPFLRLPQLYVAGSKQRFDAPSLTPSPARSSLSLDLGGGAGAAVGALAGGFVRGGWAGVPLAHAARALQRPAAGRA
eukprot:898464-Rhodomonas_salina.1